MLAKSYFEIFLVKQNNYKDHPVESLSLNSASASRSSGEGA